MKNIKNSHAFKRFVNCIPPWVVISSRRDSSKRLPLIKQKSKYYYIFAYNL